MTNAPFDTVLSRVRQGGCLLFLMFAAYAAFAQEHLPDGWRRPMPSEANEAWRKKSPSRFLSVRGDFDGDGKQDLAELLVSDAQREFGLFVRLSSRDGDWQLLHHGEIRGAIRLGDLGIQIVPPRKKTIQTLCGSDPYGCAPDTPRSINLTNGAIDFFSYETTSTYFYWDSAAKKFDAAPMSD